MTNPPKTAPRWPIVASVLSWIVGILWIVAFYAAPLSPLFVGLGNYNLLAGFGLIMLGVVFLAVYAGLAITASRRNG